MERRDLCTATKKGAARFRTAPLIDSVAFDQNLMPMPAATAFESGAPLLVKKWRYSTLP